MASGPFEFTIGVGMPDESRLKIVVSVVRGEDGGCRVQAECHAGASGADELGVAAGMLQQELAHLARQLREQVVMAGGEEGAGVLFDAGFLAGVKSGREDADDYVFSRVVNGRRG